MTMIIPAYNNGTRQVRTWTEMSSSRSTSLPAMRSSLARQGRATYHDDRGKDAIKRRAIKKLEHSGPKVTLQPAA
jgi:hypothetical protein